MDMDNVDCKSPHESAESSNCPGGDAPAVVLKAHNVLQLVTQCEKFWKEAAGRTPVGNDMFPESLAREFAEGRNQQSIHAANVAPLGDVENADFWSHVETLESLVASGRMDLVCLLGAHGCAPRARDSLRTSRHRFPEAAWNPVPQQSGSWLLGQARSQSGPRTDVLSRALWAESAVGRPGSAESVCIGGGA